MRLTVYNLIMSLLWSSLYIVIFCLLRRNYSFIQKHGIFPLIVILLLALFRFFVPIELPYTKTIYSYNFLTDLQDLLRQSSGLFSLSYGALLMILWASVSVILASRLLYGIAKQRRAVSKHLRLDNGEAASVVEELLSATGHHLNYTVIVSPDVAIPSVAGLFSPTFLLPDMELSRKELTYIIRHELFHFYNRDAWVKLFIGLFRAIFWWNPLIYMLDKDLDYVLELRCDACAVRELDEEQRIGYVEAVYSVISQAKIKDITVPNYTLAISGKYGSGKLVDRMKLVFSQGSVSHKLPVYFVCALAVFMLASYSLVIQPYGDPPQEDIEESYVFDPETYFILYENGVYSLYSDGVYLCEIDPKQLNDSPFDELEIIEP